MNPTRLLKSLFRLLLPLLLLPAALFLSRPALAAATVTDAAPDTLSNAYQSSLTVYGSGFIQGAYIVLSDGTFLQTTYLNSEMLSALVPPGLAPGPYNLTVVNGDDELVSLIPAFTITGEALEAPVSGLQPLVTEAGQVQDPTPKQGTPGDGTVPANRPLIIVRSFGADTETVTPGTDFSLTIRLENVGSEYAFNLVANFTPGEFIPLKSGGVLAVTEIDPYDTHKFVQPMRATYDLVGKYTGTAVMNVTYTDKDGVVYSETFNLSLPVTTYYGVGATATPTPTSTALPRPQILISNYSTDADMLKPGTRFKLGIQAQNVGNGLAKGVSMILGGGTSSGGNEGGTPVPGGVNAGSGDFGKFAPVSASNVQFLGDVPTGGSLTAEAELIVNSTTEPGAYPLKISFTYNSESGTSYTDDQVITLLVYSPPNVEVSFYQDPGFFFVGQPSLLPLQVVNLGRKQAVLGSMEVTAPSGQLSQNTTLVGPLEPGGYYTLDAMLIPDLPGPLDLTITIDYTDDFNQPQVITKTLAVEVQDAPPMEPPLEGGTPGPGGPLDPGMEPGIGPGGEMPVGPGGPETTVQKILRFLRGLLGLDSGQSVPGAPVEMPPGEVPLEPAPAGPAPAGKG
jgi:hypothetical protein